MITRPVTAVRRRRARDGETRCPGRRPDASRGRWRRGPSSRGSHLASATTMRSGASATASSSAARSAGAVTRSSSPDGATGTTPSSGEFRSFMHGRHEEREDAPPTGRRASPGGVNLRREAAMTRIRVAHPQRLRRRDRRAGGHAPAVPLADHGRGRVDRPADRRSPVDVVLYDSYGRPGLDMKRDRRDVPNRPTWGTWPSSRSTSIPRLVDEALAAGVTGLPVEGPLAAPNWSTRWQQVAAGEVVVSEPRPHTHPLDSPELSWPLRHRGLTVRESEAMALLVHRPAQP